MSDESCEPQIQRNTFFWDDAHKTNPSSTNKNQSIIRHKTTTSNQLKAKTDRFVHQIIMRSIILFPTTSSPSKYQSDEKQQQQEESSSTRSRRTYWWARPGKRRYKKKKTAAVSLDTILSRKSIRPIPVSRNRQWIDPL
jgi:hypothetical protein